MMTLLSSEATSVPRAESPRAGCQTRFAYSARAFCRHTLKMERTAPLASQFQILGGLGRELKPQHLSAHARTVIVTASTVLIRFRAAIERTDLAETGRLAAAVVALVFTSGLGVLRLHPEERQRPSSADPGGNVRADRS